MKRIKELKIVYAFEAAVPNWQERLDSACNLIFKKMADKYEGEKKTYERQYI